MPRHPRRLQNTKRVTRVFVNLLEIQYARIVEVLAWEQSEREVRRMHVRQRMCVCIPASEAKVESANTCTVIVYDDNLQPNLLAKSEV